MRNRIIYLYNALLMKKNATTKELIISQAVSDLKDGDYSNFNIIYEETNAAVYSFLRQKLLNDPSMAEDLTSETYIKFLLSLDRYTHINRFRLRSFLYSIAFRIFVDYYRKFKNIRFTEIDEETLNLFKTDASTITQPIDRKIGKQALSKALSRLDPKYQRVLELFYMKEMSYKEIQQELNMPETTIKVQLCRARNLLRVQMKKSKVFKDRMEANYTPF